jgi:hypothetical protein
VSSNEVFVFENIPCWGERDEKIKITTLLSVRIGSFETKNDFQRKHPQEYFTFRLSTYKNDTFKSNKPRNAE